jgi:formylglycine-generating enzyme
MKNAKHIAPFIAILYALGALVSCNNPFGARSGSMVSLGVSASYDGASLSPSSKTVLPSLPSISRYVLSGALSGSTEATLATVSELSAISLSLAKGSYDFTLAAYNSSGALVLSGTKVGVVLSDSAATLSFTLSAASSGSGSVNVSVGWPGSIAVSSVVTGLDGATVSPGLSISGSSVTYSASSVSSGNHILTFSLNDSSGNALALASELVTVVANLTSSKAITLSAADFNSAPVAPSGVTATYVPSADSTGSALISWTDNSDNETGFRIFDGSKATTASAAATSATITGLTRGLQCIIVVSAVNNFGRSSATCSYIVPAFHSITYNANGGSGSMDAQTVEENGKTNLMANDYRLAGFHFLGWASASAASSPTYTDGQSYTMGTADVSLYAVWSGTWTSPTYAAMVADGSCAGVTLSAASGSSAIAYSMATTESSAATTYISPFAIGKHEVSYELWYTVKTWALAHGYTFGYQGREGNDGTDGAAPTASSCLEPVTTVSWRDCMVWCNAYTEWYNATVAPTTALTCAYCSTGAYVTPVRTSSANSTIDTTAGGYDSPYVSPSATGFRLPTEVEWQYAASGGGAQSYDYISGDTSADWHTSTVVGDYAWYMHNSSACTHRVGSKKANALGLYDMTGNVYEWCFDWSATPPTYAGQTDYKDSTFSSSSPFRVMRGSCWYESDMNLQIGYRTCYYPYNGDDYNGFRVVSSVH